MSAIDRATIELALSRPSDESSDFDLNPNSILPAGRILRPAGVLITLWDRVDGTQVILTKRSSRLKHHPGQIAFPGGKVEPGDNGPEGAALREAQEEIGLPPERVTIVGTLPLHETVTGFAVTPVLGLMRGDFVPTREPGEVEEVFCVPLSHLANPARYSIERRQWRGEWRRYYAVPWGPYYIWGATARILRGLAERLSP